MVTHKNDNDTIFEETPLPISMAGLFIFFDAIFHLYLVTLKFHSVLLLLLTLGPKFPGGRNIDFFNFYTHANVSSTYPVSPSVSR